MDITILGIESSCDDTSAAVIRNNLLLSNVIASQAVHIKYGGVIPELASRAHQQNIIPVVDTALREAGLTVGEIDAIAFTRGPGLLGSLLVGVSFAKGLSVAHDIPMVEVNHLQGHILSHFIDLRDRTLPHPDFPFLCLLVSGGHTQIVRVDSPLEMEIIGTTIDDAAGEAFDKCAKVMGLPYPGGPVIDRLAKEGDPNVVGEAYVTFNVVGKVVPAASFEYDDVALHDAAKEDDDLEGRVFDQSKGEAYDASLFSIAGEKDVEEAADDEEVVEVVEEVVEEPAAAPKKTVKKVVKKKAE